MFLDCVGSRVSKVGEMAHSALVATFDLPPPPISSFKDPKINDLQRGMLRKDVSGLGLAVEIS